VAGEAHAAVRMVHAGQRAHQRRLARTVRSDQGHAIALLDHEIEAVDHDVVAVRAAQALELDHDAAGLGRIREVEVDLLPLGWDLDDLDLVQGLDPALDLPGLGGLVAELVDERAGFVDLFLLPPVGLAQPLHGRRVLDDVLRVVAVVVGQRLEPDLGDPLDRGVEEVPIVGDEDHRARIVLEVFLQPVPRGQVEMVGRLVHEEEVRPGQQQLGQRDAHLPAARELLCPARLVGQREAEALEHVGHARVDLVPAEVLEAIGDLRVALEPLVVVLAVVVAGAGQGVLDPVLLLLEASSSSKARITSS